MNILDALNKDIKSFIFRYYGSGDYSSYFDLEDLIKNISIVDNYFKAKSFNIDSVDDFIDYMYLRKFSQFEDIIPFVKEEKKLEVDNIIKLVVDYYKNYKIKDVIKFLNANYKSVIENSKYDMIEIILDIAIKYHSGCIKIVEYFIDTHCYMLIYNFDRVQDIVLKNKDFVSKILDKKHFEEMKFSGLKQYLSVIKFLIKNKNVDNNFDEILNEILKFANDIYSKINEDTYLQYERFYKDVVDFFIEIKHKEAYTLESNYKSLSTVKDSYMKKHGKEFSIEIPMNDIESFVKDERISLQQKILYLTHSVRDKKITNLLEDIGKNSKKTLSDEICSTTMPHDDYFTISKQEHLQAFSFVINKIIHFFISKDKIQEFISTLAGMTEFVCKNIEIKFADTEFLEDYNILLNMFLNLFSAYDVKNDYLITGLNYGITMFIFGMLEKLLRFYYRYKKTDTYIKEDWFSLGHLLDENDEIMLELFGKDHLKILKYYLVNSNIGYNLRNNYAHYKNIGHKDIHYGVTLTVLYLYIDVLNQIIIKFDNYDDM